jgi:hypothetical protein
MTKDSPKYQQLAAAVEELLRAHVEGREFWQEEQAVVDAAVAFVGMMSRQED